MIWQVVGWILAIGGVLAFVVGALVWWAVSDLAEKMERIRRGEEDNWG